MYYRTLGFTLFGYTVPKMDYYYEWLELLDEIDEMMDDINKQQHSIKRLLYDIRELEYDMDTSPSLTLVNNWDWSFDVE